MPPLHPQFRQPWSECKEMPYSVRIRENADQKNSEYRHFSRSGDSEDLWNSLENEKIAKTFQTINDRCCHSIKTSQLIFRKNQLTGFYMKGKMVVSRFSIIFYQFFSEATPELFYEKGVLKNLAKFTGSTCGGVSF